MGIMPSKFCFIKCLASGWIRADISTNCQTLNEVFIMSCATDKPLFHINSNKGYGLNAFKVLFYQVSRQWMD